MGLIERVGRLGGILGEVGMAFMLAIYWIARRWAPGTVRRGFGRLQGGSAALMAFTHASNDGDYLCR